MMPPVSARTSPRLLVLASIAALLGQIAIAPILAQQGSPTDLEIRQAAAAIEQADGYADIVAATERYAAVISSPRVVQLVDDALQNPALSGAQRGVLLLERQLSLDCRTLGAAPAAKLLAVRVIAAGAMAADTPLQFAATLEKFAPFAGTMNVALVRQALDMPGNSWPKPLIPLMEQLARDWPKLGALGAATRMSEAANAAPAPTAGTAAAPAPTLAGHWRKTSIVFESPRDEHLVLHEDGTAETWTATASGRTPSTRGRWSAKGGMLSVTWEDGRQWGQPFTFFEGQLVFPNISNQRQFWEPMR
jgi:hypothetical protein